ncbi:MAG: hypothetical protein ACFE96_00945 [Candidatus Hermodarchaeota archaeon]
MSQNILLEEICGHMVGRSRFIFYKNISWDFTATPILEMLRTIVSKFRFISNFIGFENKIPLTNGKISYY